MPINLISSKDSGEVHSMLTKSDNLDIMMDSETDDFIEDICESLLQKYQKGLEESMRGSEFTFDSVDLLYYNLQKTSLNRIKSPYIDSPEWLYNCFQYALTVA